MFNVNDYLKLCWKMLKKQDNLLFFHANESYFKTLIFFLIFDDLPQPSDYVYLI